MMQELILVLTLAATLSGETPACPIEAKISAAYVYEVNSTWFASDAPSAEDIYVAFWYRNHDNPAPGAKYFISPADVARMPFLKRMIKEWICLDSDGNVVTIVQAWE